VNESLSSLIGGSGGRSSSSSSTSCFNGNRLGSWYSRLNNVDDSFRASRRHVLKTWTEINVGYLTYELWELCVCVF